MINVIINRFTIRNNAYWTKLSSNHDTTNVYIITHVSKILEYSSLFENVIPVSDWSDDSAFVDILQSLKERSDIHNILNFDESDVCRVAKLRELFCIPGQKKTEAILFRDKFYMREMFCNDEFISYYTVDDFIDLKMNLDKVGLPCVLKPRLGMGSVGVHKINETSDLDNLIGVDLSNYLLESWIEGSLIAVDAVCYGGKVIQLYASEYEEGGCLNAIPSCKLITEQAIIDSLSEYLSSKLNVINHDRLDIFHMEVFLYNGRINLCEIAVRPGGAFFPNFYEFCSGDDYVYQFIRKCFFGLDMDFGKTDDKCRYDWILLPKSQGLYLHLVDEINDQNSKYSIPVCGVKQGSLVSKNRRHSADILYAYGIRSFPGDDVKKLRKTADKYLIDETVILEPY
ncbi:TPA: acetyl-CoA carboxylase biotin carboxylase subunit family protein [Vibrio vulnificus]|nr:carbamoyl phosphate synthase-like protein [Vibrio fluvialis]POB24208.1 hypothetical protein CRN47_13730 [Vibrio vulnificus]